MPDRTDSLPSQLNGDRYRLTGEIARGGMATVYRAHDQVLGRDVAVKILHGHLAHDETFLDRFRREARAAATFSHPHIVSIFDWGEDEEGAFLVMELVDGPSLRDVLRIRGRLAPRETLALLEPVARALGAAHDAGLVHRDVKPENVLLSRDGTVKVTDFGLARATASSTQTFGSDVIVGSPHYLAPEAVRGDPLTPRSDVYSFGVLLYECLTGRPPFEGETPMATAVQHTARQVPAPSDQVPGVSPALDEVVRGATAPDPDDRYPDGATTGGALRDAVPEGPVAVDLRDGRHDTLVLPVTATDTVVTSGRPAPGDGATAETGEDAPAEGAAQGPAGHAGTRPARRRKRRRWLRRLLVALVLAAATAGAAWAFVLAPVADVPPVQGLAEDAAVAELKEAGFDVEVAGTTTSLQIPPGHVAEVDPADRARKGSTITLTLSEGPRQVELPELTGGDPEAAAAELRDLGVEPAVEEVFHEQVPEGQVVGTDPPAGNVVDEATSVRLLVSRGREPIEVPGVVGEEVGTAVSTLGDLGLDPQVIEEVFHDTVPAGHVVSQSPEPGETRFRGDQVQLRTSKGPEPFPMPEVTGEPESEARRTLEGAGLIVQVERVDAFLRPSGVVADQDPDPETPVRRGEKVTIYVWQ